MAESLNYYEILYISPQATLSEIKTAFRRLARQYHPDLNPNNPAAELKFKQINQAYQVLCDPHQRHLYDQQVNSNFAQSSPSKLTEQDYYHRGITQTQCQNHLDAIKSFTKAIELNPTFIEAYLRRIETFDKIQKYRQVLEDCNHVLQLNPNSPQAYYYLGCSRQHLGYTQSAIEAYTQAIQMQPTNAQCYYHRGLAYHELKDFSLAFKDFEQAIYLFRKEGDYRLFNLAYQDLQKTFKQMIRVKIKLILTPFIFLYQGIINFLYSLKLLLIKPKTGLVEAYLRLDKKQVFGVGIIYGLITYVLFLRLNLLQPIVLNGLPFINLSLVSFISRNLCRRYGHLAGDIFLAGSSLLPIAILGELLTIFNGLQPFIKNSFILIFLSYSSFMLYTGCTQISNLPRWLTILIVPLMLLVASFPLWGLY